MSDPAIDGGRRDHEALTNVWICVPTGASSTPFGSQQPAGENRRVLLWPAPLTGPAVLPRSIRTDQPTDPVTCVLPARDGLDWAGRGIGTSLVKRALRHCVTAAGLVGGRALPVNTLDDEAAAFWRWRGFLPSKGDPMVLFRSIAEIAASVRG